MRYHSPEIIELIGPGAYEADTAGGGTFYVQGNYFGPATPNTKQDGTDGHVDFVAFQAQNEDEQIVGQLFQGYKCTVINAQILIECTSPVGVGKNFAYQAQVGGQSSVQMKNLMNNFNKRPSYAPPVISVLERSKARPMDDADTRGYTVPDTSSGFHVPETVIISVSTSGDCMRLFIFNRP